MWICVAYGPKYSKKNIKERVDEASRILGLEQLLDRKPKQLSGGQRQRVALGRAIVRKPKVFLFDEPLSNLDAKLRVQMRTEISKLHIKLEATMIYVTHDQTEAMTMGDRIVVMKDGAVQQIDKPIDLYNKPVNKFVASFIGSPSMNFINGVVKNRNGFFFISSKNQLRIELSESYKKMLNNFCDKNLVFFIDYDGTLTPIVESPELAIIPEDMKQLFGWIDEVASFEVSFSVNRKEFNIGTGTATPGLAALRYSQVVGNEVNIKIAVEVNRKTS